MYWLKDKGVEVVRAFAIDETVNGFDVHEGWIELKIDNRTAYSTGDMYTVDYGHGLTFLNFWWKNKKGWKRVQGMVNGGCDVDALSAKIDEACMNAYEALDANIKEQIRADLICNWYPTHLVDYYMDEIYKRTNRRTLRSNPIGISRRLAEQIEEELKEGVISCER